MDPIVNIFEDDETEVTVGKYITYDEYVIQGNMSHVRRTEHIECVGS